MQDRHSGRVSPPDARVAPIHPRPLFAIKSYPTNPLDVQSFYAESAILVDFLTMTDQRRALLPKFVDAMIHLNNVSNAVTLYGYRNLADFEYAYRFYRSGF